MEWNHLVDCDDGSSPMSPRYKDNDYDSYTFTCDFCWQEFDINCMIVEQSGDKTCPECHEYNKSIQE